MTEQEYRRGLGWVLAAAIAVRLSLFWGDFVDYDDRILIQDNPFVTQLTWAHFTTILLTNYRGEYQNGMYLAHQLNWWASGGRYAGFALFNLAWFAGTLVVFARFARTFLDRKWALAATAVLAVHAINANTLGWMAARAHLLGLPIALGALLAWRRAATTEDTDKATPYYALSIGLMWLAAWCKQVYIGLPVAVVIYDLWLDRPRDRRFWLDKLLPAGLLLWSVTRPWVLDNMTPPGPDLTTAQKLYVRAGMLVEYGLSLLIPRDTAVGVYFVPPLDLTDTSAAGLWALSWPPLANLTLLGLVLFGAVALYRRGNRTPLLMVLLAGVAIAPSLKEWPNVTTADFGFRHALLTSAYFAVLATSVFAWFYERAGASTRRVLAAVGVAFLLGHAAKTAQQTARWTDHEALWTSCYEAFPLSTLCHAQVAEIDMERGEHERAIALLEQADAVRTRYGLYRRAMTLHLAIAKAYRQLDRPADELRHLDRAFVQDRMSPEQWERTKKRRMVLRKQLGQ